MRFLSTLLASTIGTLLAIAFTLFFGLLFVFALASASESAPSVRSGSVLVANLSGSYPESVSGDPISQVFGGESPLDLHDVARVFQMAATDSRIEAVWLRMGNMSAPWATLQVIRRGVEAVRASGKPVYASSESYAMAEDEYFIASAADSVFLDPESLFEFNGFALDVTFYKRLMDKAGVAPQVVRAGRFKSAVEPYLRDDLSDDNEAQLSALLQGVSDLFFESVAASRGLNADVLSDLAASSALFTAEQALASGLVDELIFRDQIVDRLRARIGVADGEDVRSVDMRAYARTSPSDAGLRSGNEGDIAVVFGVGAQVPGDPGETFPPSSDLGAAAFTKSMREARDNDRIRAVVIRIDSPGGFAPAADAMRREIELTAKEKPVLVSMGSVAASGGYWMAVAADTIVAERLTLTGSIGVFGLMFDFSDLLEDKIGVTFDGVRTGPFADMASGMRPLSASERVLLESSVDATYGRFLDLVAAARGMTAEQVDEIAQGRVWTGEDALEIGLVDVLGGLDEAIALAADRVGLEAGTYRTRELPRPRGFIERLSRSVNGQSVRVWSRVLGEVPPVARAVSEFASVTRSAGSVQARTPFQVTVR